MNAMNTTTEIWKDIPGYAGKYQVSNLGRVKSLSRKARIRNRKDGSAAYRALQERILKPGLINAGHQSVALGERQQQASSPTRDARV